MNLIFTDILYLYTSYGCDVQQRNVSNNASSILLLIFVVFVLSSGGSRTPRIQDVSSVAKPLLLCQRIQGVIRIKSLYKINTYQVMRFATRLARDMYNQFRSL